MVQIKSSKGGLVDVEIKGVAQARLFLNLKNKDITDGAEAGLFQAANLVQQEVQESITGNRKEHKSVDTGRLANSIVVDKANNETFIVFPERQTYPGTKTTTQDVATFMEYGTSKGLQPRRHFRNTSKRTEEESKQIVEKAIKWAIK